MICKVKVFDGQLDALYEDESVKLSVKCSGCNSGAVLFCFTGVGHALGGIDIQREEFSFVDGFESVIFVIDKKRSWGNDLNFLKIKDVVSPYVEGRRIFGLGNSMGGFNACVFSSHFEVKACVSFCSQYSVDPSVIPEENRWNEYVSRISCFLYKSLDDVVKNNTRYYFFSGDAPSEKRHWCRFPKAENIFNCVIEGGEHNVANYLKGRGILYELIERCVKGEGFSELFLNNDVQFYMIN